MGAYTAHVDTFAEDNLPPKEQWPVFLLDRPELAYPERLNCVSELLDGWTTSEHRDRPAVASPSERWTYGELAERVARIANVLVSRLGLVPGNRVLLRAPNNPMLVACYLGVLKAGGVVVATMPLLRAKELGYIIRKAQISLALCDHRLLGCLRQAQDETGLLRTITPVGADGADDLLALMRQAEPAFAACPTAADDICVIGFTSGTTGEPKGTMHNHRDLLAVCDTYGRHVLKAKPEDIFIGSPPLAFTFGLGGLTLFPMRVGASTVLLEKAGPDELIEAFRRFRPTVCFTAPTAYRAMLAKLEPGDTASLKKCVSAGEALPEATWRSWKEATGLSIMDGIGATEMLHIFIGAPQDAVRPGSTGVAVPGYEAKIVDERGRNTAPGVVGRLAVRGPTGCRYLADTRQQLYVEAGWNLTGDIYLMDEDGYFWYQARSDDMIISAGYNIAGPEVEAALMSHPAVQECGVAGAPDAERGQSVKAYVVLKPGHAPDAATIRMLQDHVKAEIAPYKYPRIIAFVDALPRTENGKLQRFVLRERATREAGTHRERAASSIREKRHEPNRR